MIDQFQQYLIRRHRSINTIRLRLFYVRKFSDWHHGDLVNVTETDLENYLDHGRIVLGWSENTQQSASSSLRVFYAWATREGLLPADPSRELPDIHPRRRRPRIASEDAIAHAVECTDLADKAMVMLGAECGLRVSEIAHLHRDNRDGEWLHIIGKGGYQRSLHLSPELQVILDTIEHTTMCKGFYFPGRSRQGPIHSSTAWRHISTALSSNPHSLRRRAGTIVYRSSGNDIRLAQVFLGHKHSSTTEDYLDIADDDLILASTLTRLAA
jgi:integrase